MARRPPRGSRHAHLPHRREPARSDGARAEAARQDAARADASAVDARRPDPASVAPALGAVQKVDPADDGGPIVDATAVPGQATIAVARPVGSLDGPRADDGVIARPGSGPGPATAGLAAQRSSVAVADARAGSPGLVSPAETSASLAPASPSVGLPPVAGDGTVGSDAAQGGDPRRSEGTPDLRVGCTAAQLRRFIKSRAWIPMHELRRRFAIDGGDDEVVPVDVQARRVFVGLPDREARMLGDLLRSGEVGYELSLDPSAPIVIGIYPMRPVTRA